VVVGFCRVEVCPLPKSQFQKAGALVERSLKLTPRGPQPEVVLAEKLATGAWALAAIIPNHKKPEMEKNSFRINERTI